MNNSHVEQAPHYLWMKLFLGGIMIYFVGMTYYVYMIPEEAGVWPIMLGACVLMAWGFSSFFTMRYEVHDESVVAVMWPFKHRVPFSEIKSVTLNKIPWWAGIGYHIMGKSHYVNTVYGTCVLIEKKKGSRLYITPRDPEDFLTLFPKVKEKKVKEN